MNAVPASVIEFTLGAVAEVNSLPTYGPACAGGSQFTATVNNWKPTGTATAFTDGLCVITLAGSSDVAGDTAAGLGALSMDTNALSFD